MEYLVGIQRWLYQGIGDGLSQVAGGNARVVWIAMATAMLFGAVHALMPGHGKIVLVFYHLGKPSKALAAFTNGAILALTHVGLAVALVLAGYIVISRAFAYGGRTPQFVAASGVLITLIGAYLLWAAFSRRHHESDRGRTLALATGMIPCPLTTFVLTFALAKGVLVSGLLVTAAMAAGMVATIGGVALVAALTRNRLMVSLARSEAWRHRVGLGLEVGSAALVLLLGVATLIQSTRT
jgi:ABC-type nickel/cobalt efflux system permease component RcnA